MEIVMPKNWQLRKFYWFTNRSAVEYSSNLGCKELEIRAKNIEDQIYRKMYMVKALISIYAKYYKHSCSLFSGCVLLDY